MPLHEQRVAKEPDDGHHDIVPVMHEVGVEVADTGAGSQPKTAKGSTAEDEHAGQRTPRRSGRPAQGTVPAR